MSDYAWVEIDDMFVALCFAAVLIVWLWKRHD